MAAAPLPPADPEAYAALVRDGLTLEALGRRVGRSAEHVRQVLLRGGYRTRDLRPPRPPPDPRQTAACAGCGKPLPFRPVGRRFLGGPRFCGAPACRRAAHRWRYQNRPAARAALLLATRRGYWRRAHGTELPPELAGPRGQQYCAACGARTVQYLPGRPVRYCTKAECRRAGKVVRDRERRARAKGARAAHEGQHPPVQSNAPTGTPAPGSTGDASG